MKPALEGLANEATETGEQLGTSMERVDTTLQEVLQACMDERLEDTRTVEEMADEGR